MSGNMLNYTCCILSFKISLLPKAACVQPKLVAVLLVKKIVVLY